jgi:nitroreductase
MDFDKLVKERKSVRKYSNDKPDWRKIVQAIDYARFAPMAGGIFTPRFIVVSDDKKLKLISDACQQNFVGDAQYIVAVVSENKKCELMFEERAASYSKQQAGAAIENFILALNNLGLVTCWTGFYDDDQVRRALELPENIVLEAIFPIGKPTKIKERELQKAKLENFLFFDKFGNKRMQANVITGYKNR